MSSFPQRTIGAAHRLAVVAIAMLLAGAACSGGGSTGGTVDAFGNTVAGGTDDQADAQESAGDRTALVVPAEESADGQTTASAANRSPLADLITELPPAPTGLPTAPVAQRRPVGLSIDALGVDVATVIDVGVEDNGDMEIPPADQVGWYRYGPTPGEAGASVLAAHIAYDGEDGVFVELDDLEVGSLIQVAYDDGTTADFVAVSKEQYDKAELPREQVWGRTGDPRLVLITCGGDFNRQISSYDDNVVVYANPVGLDRS